MLKTLAVAVLAILTVGTAQAQSLKDAPINWSGPYAGLVIGWGTSDGEQAQTNGGMVPGPFKIDGEGAFGGAVLGYNHQINQLVLGVELEAGYLDVGGDGKVPSVDPTKVQNIDVDSGLYAVFAGRLGYAFDRTLVYGKAGYAVTDIDAGQKTTKPGFVTHRSDSLQGWVYGAGVEHMLTERISLKAEWLRFDFDSVTGDQESITDVPVGFRYTNKTDLEIDTFKLGINFKF